MPCPELLYYPGISSLTLLAITLDVFEAVAHQHMHRAANQYTGSTNTQLT